MPYELRLEVLAQYREQLFDGLLMTVWLSVASTAAGTFFGVVLASLRSVRGGPVRFLVDAYVEVIRNTPFLVQLFIIYFGLPTLGLRVGAVTAALIGMTINLAAYSTEIIRAGIESIHKSQIEAGEALGLTQLQIYRDIIILPAVAKVYPSLCSQFVLMMLASSVCSAISTPELTAAASYAQSQSYRSFEVYIAVTLIYLALALTLRGGLALIGWRLFGRPGRRATQPTFKVEAV
ncbi:amino acid ABC transporter permease [Xanthobacter oligotrophicus]|uniref:amino acid ABC transporter permease n=1 Tax=Xanthobacter oligotrophicus TaxID=2607286 RepID=UPI0011F29C10|nr:amino acid ABC transporter permease [Xanthobacter oligotrophicus]MCG5234583.1 amino acid ABC transporter permease [Xanthobacter oligotrophicus]